MRSPAAPGRAATPRAVQGDPGAVMPVRRYPDHDPRSWGLPMEATVSGQWIEDRRERSGWRWDGDAPAADPAPTMIRNAPVAHSHELGTPRRDPAMSEPQQPDELVAFDPNDPHDPSIEAPQGFERPGGVQPAPEPPISVCPTCGTAVATDRLRG